MNYHFEVEELSSHSEGPQKSLRKTGRRCADPNKPFSLANNLESTEGVVH
jgi:hypothetical protein